MHDRGYDQNYDIGAYATRSEQDRRWQTTNDSPATPRRLSLFEQKADPKKRPEKPAKEKPFPNFG